MNKNSSQVDSRQSSPDLCRSSPDLRQSSLRPRRPHIEKIYVKVNSDFDQTGMITPRSITWKDGRVFPIEMVESFRPASTLEPGRTGDCYTVIIKGERKYLFFKRNLRMNDHRIGRWWVEVSS